MSNALSHSRAPSPLPGLVLRAVVDADLPAFFLHQQDRTAVHMAAFISADPSDRAAFDAHWSRIRTNPEIVIRTIALDGAVVGHVAGFVRDGKREVTYWIDRTHWGRGVATQALALFLREYSQRPIHAAAAADNAGSLRVLRKCGFVETGRGRGFAPARGAEIEEVFLVLPA